MSRLRRAAFATAVVQCFSIVGLVLSFVTVPLYLAWLGKERYGLMLTAQACAGYLAFSDAGLSWSSLLLISHAHGRDDRSEIARIVRNSLTLAGLSGLLVAILTLATCVGLRNRLAFLPLPTSNPESAGLALAIGTQVIVALIASPLYNIFFGLQESHISTVYQGMGRILGTGLSLLAAAHGASIGTVVGGGVVGALVCGVACTVHAWKKHPWAFVQGSFWDREQIRLQLRTGAKSFGLQIGRTLVGSAPVIAISSQAGAGSVPVFTVALTLLNTPLNIVTYFNAMLQSGYGEAVGKQDYSWIRATLRAVLRNMLLVQGLLAAGFLTLAGLAISFWTHDKLHATKPLLLSALIVGVSISITSALQFALSGINRHKMAGVAEMLNGLCCLAFAPLVVRFVGPEWVGLGILAATLLTCGWILPSQIKKHLGMEHLWPTGIHLLSLVAAFSVATAVGWALLQFSTLLMRHELVALLLGGIIIVASYIIVLRLFVPEDVTQLTDFFLRRFSRQSEDLPVQTTNPKF